MRRGMRRAGRRSAWLCGPMAVVGLGAACGLQTDPPPRPSATSSSRSSSSAPTSASPPTRVVPPSPRPRYPGCRTGGDPRAGVNTPIRLVVRNPCVRVRGIAGCISTDRGDGDTHIALLLSRSDAAKYLTPGNRAWTCSSDQGSDTAARLVVEIIPQHCTVRPDNCADRGGFTNPPVPRNGQHITVTGPWVLDTSHFRGHTLWSEIHPAWRITVDEDDPGVPDQGGGYVGPEEED